MTHKASQIRLTDEDKARIIYIKERTGLQSTSAAIRYAITKLCHVLRLEEKRDEAEEAMRNYNRGLGLP